MGVCAITGCGGLTIIYEQGTATTKEGVVLKRGDIITLDGTAGEVMLGDMATFTLPEETARMARHFWH